MQGVGISACTSRFSDKTLLQFSCLSLIVSFYLMALLTTLQDFLLLQVAHQFHFDSVAFKHEIFAQMCTI